MAGLNLQVKCGSCPYLKVKHPAIQAPCEELGKLVSSAACKHYDVDHTSNRVDPMTLFEIGKLTKDLPMGVKHAIAYSLVNGGELERASLQKLGFVLQLGEPCYVNLGTSDYLNSWFRAYAIGVTKGIKGLILFSKSNGEKPTFIIKSFANPDDIMSRKDFKAHVKDLVKSKRINAPKPKRKSMIAEYFPELPKKIDPASYKPAAIGTIPLVGIDPNNNVMVGRKANKASAKTIEKNESIKKSKTRSGNAVYSI